MAATGRAAYVQGKDVLPVHRYVVKGMRSVRREAKMAASVVADFG